MFNSTIFLNRFYNIKTIMQSVLIPKKHLKKLLIELFLLIETNHASHFELNLYSFKELKLIEY